MLSIKVPRRLGQYWVGSTIFETGTALISETTNPSSNEKLALKIIDKNKALEEHYQNECSLVREMRHEYLMSAVEIFDQDDFRIIVFPLAVGGDLFEFLNKNGALSERLAMKFAFTALTALDYMHSKDIWHRDIKPENFLLMDSSLTDPYFVLSDFGFSKRFPPGYLCDEYLGTPLYSAPEIHKRIPYDKSVDIWALGVTLYIALSRRSPFPPGDYYQRGAIINGDYNFDGPEWEDVSEGAKDLIFHMMRVDPSERITAQEALEHPWIRRYLESEQYPGLYYDVKHQFGFDVPDLDDEFDGGNVF
ncbi:calcium/calmodulin-dependent protein kinase type 1 [Histomonas meleagridis]|uniref:calcium/calmodulin-dependent protein kinase type 1 n=1 Tax=Histomonas meleagridis TaxID=135588 RepID=UPI00355AB786|nr:calcium/calmodulin-dependent protein kinase type 1 [Histomonas meleagridis]KAH0806795.1 calcium/calmodulin-dependent protein kinase type 1 [Histomonas meleagridis]